MEKGRKMEEGREGRRDREGNREREERTYGKQVKHIQQNIHSTTE